MITESFDGKSEAIINPRRKENAPTADACIVTFSHLIEKFVLENYDCERIGNWNALREPLRFTDLSITAKNSLFTKPMWARLRASAR